MHPNRHLPTILLNPSQFLPSMHKMLINHRYIRLKLQLTRSFIRFSPKLQLFFQFLITIILQLILFKILKFRVQLIKILHLFLFDLEFYQQFTIIFSNLIHAYIQLFIYLKQITKKLTDFYLLISVTMNILEIYDLHLE